jgi:hypothetical protein
LLNEKPLRRKQAPRRKTRKVKRKLILDLSACLQKTLTSIFKENLAAGEVSNIKVYSFLTDNKSSS